MMCANEHVVVPKSPILCHIDALIATDAYGGALRLKSGSCAPLRSVASGDLRLEAVASRPIGPVLEPAMLAVLF
jgi:hypothetical protein